MKRNRASAIVQYILMLTLLIVLCLAVGNRWLWGLTAFILLIPPVSLCTNLYVRKKINGEIQISTTAAKHNACLGSILLENTAWLPATKLFCRLGIINDLTHEKNTLELATALSPRKNSRHDFSLESAYCGRVYIYVQSVLIMDYFGLFALDVPLKAAARITILPNLFACDVVSSPVSAVSEDSTISRKGDDRTEVFQLREYQSGDDIRQIHWKLSSKLDKLILREPSQSVSRSILVFWDKRHECPPENMDAMAEVSASICQSLCDKGTNFDLCWTEKDDLELLRIRNSEVLLQAIPALVTQAGDADCPEPNLDGYGLVIYITSQIPDSEAIKGIAYLVCTDKEYEDGSSVVFSSTNYSERLERLEI